jgi:hypothetical protein
VFSLILYECKIFDNVCFAQYGAPSKYMFNIRVHRADRGEFWELRILKLKMSKGDKDKFLIALFHDLFDERPGSESR